MTKKILLDLLERFLLRGPVGGEKQQSTSRATLSRKLSRALGKVNDSDVFEELGILLGLNMMRSLTVLMP